MVASGVHTQAAAIGLMVRRLADLAVVAGRSLDTARFHRPTLPDETYAVSVRWLQTRPSARDPARGQAVIAGRVEEAGEKSGGGVRCHLRAGAPPRLICTRPVHCSGLRRRADRASSGRTRETTMTSKHPETLALHAGWRRDSATHAVAVPIYQTTSFQFDSAEQAANLFGLKELGNIYTRIMNPTCDALEQRVAALEGGAAALALASGQAASALAVQNLARVGDNIVASTDLYGGTWNLFANTFRDQGIEVRFVDPADPEAFARATDERTRAYYAETLPNPKLRDIPDRRSGRDRPRPGHSADHGQHRRPDSGAPIRPWCRGDCLFAHEISRRPRHHDRRHDRRWRQFRLGCPSRPPAGAAYARSELSRRGMGRGGEAARADRLRAESPGNAAARSRAGTQPVQRVSGAAGRRDGRAAYAGAQRERARDWPASSPTARR